MKTIRNTWLSLVCVMIAMGGITSASFADDKKEPTALEKSRALAKADYEAKVKKFGERKDVFIRPGVFANSHEKTIQLWGVATGLAEDAPVEFLLASDTTGRDYETVTLIHAKASDVHAALEYIGMKAGRPVNYAGIQFWPKGERVMGTIEWTDADGKKHTGPLEKTVLDIKTKQPLPAAGLVFVGSITRENEKGEKQYAADINGSRSIGSTYNEPTTVLDIPRYAPQSVVYGQFLPNPKFSPAVGTTLKITLTPEKKDGSKRVVDLKTTISMKKSDKGVEPTLTMVDAAGKTHVDAGDMQDAVGKLVTLVRDGRTPFVHLTMDDALTLDMAGSTALALGQLESDPGFRIDAPPAGQLYYKAFNPPEMWKNRLKRGSRPWELVLAKDKDGKAKASLVELKFDWGKRPVEVTERSFELGSPKDLKTRLSDENMVQYNDLIIKAPKDLTYGQLREWVKPVMKSHTIWVYVE